MRIKKINVGPLQVCCYIVMGNLSSEAMIIDPGADGEKIIAFIKDEHLTPKFVVITHGHGDHIGANARLKEAYPNIQICVHEADEDMLPYPAKNLSILAAFYGGITVRSPAADRLLKDGDTVTIDTYTFEVIHTPGHTPGGICLYNTNEVRGTLPIVHVDLLLLQHDRGGTDFPGCSEK